MKRPISLACLFGFLLIVLLGGAPADSRAQEASDATALAEETSLPDGLSQTEINALIAGLTDAEVRQLLIARLKLLSGEAEAARAASQKSFFEMMNAGAVDMRAEFLKTVGAADDIIPDLVGIWSRVAGEGGNFHILWVVAVFLLTMAAGYGLERLARPLWSGVRARLSQPPADALGTKLVYGLGRVVLALLSVGVFFIGAAVVFMVLAPDTPASRQLIGTYALMVIYLRIVFVGLDILFNAGPNGDRFVPLDDETATRMHQMLIPFFIFDRITLTSLDLFKDLGMAEPPEHLLRAAVGTIIALWLAAIVWHTRRGVAAAIRGDHVEDRPAAGTMRQLFAGLWHILALIFLIATWAVWLTNILTSQIGEAKAAFLSLILLLVLPLADRAIRFLLAVAYGRKRAIEPLPGSGRAILRATRLVMIIAFLLALAEAWGVGVVEAYATDIGKQVAHAAVEILLAVLIGYVLWDVIRAALDRRIHDEDPNAHLGSEGLGAEGGGAGNRLKTLLPLLKTVIMITIVAMVIMVVLSALGVNIGPLLAGAGVVGLALGLGAQRLVQDIISGVFFLVDDAFRVGEFIEVGELKGRVESLSIRSMRLRHHRGPVQTVPYSEVTYVKNHSRDWVIVKFEFRVPYDTDIEKIRKLVKKVGQEMLTDEEIGPNILEPLKSQGVYEFADSYITVRAKFTAKPGEQFLIRRQAYMRIKAAFEANGIEFARPQVMVHVPEGASEAEKQAAAAQAAQAAQAPSAGGSGPG